MALRISPDELKSYVGASANDTSDITIFMDQANLLVDETLVDQGLSENRLKYIELNLAAHYWVLSREHGGFKMQKVGESMETYQDSAGANLRSTRFGQQAVALDASGQLATLAAPAGKAEFRVM